MSKRRRTKVPMSKVLVVGASSFVGRYLTKLLSAEHEVWSVGRSVPEGTTRERFIECDLSEIGAAMENFPAAVDAVIYLAQSRRYREFPAGAGDVCRVNVDAPVALANWATAVGAEKFVYASSGSVYAPSDRKLTEESPLLSLGSTNFYGMSKLAAEGMLQAFSARMSVAILRPFFIYGAGQSPDMFLARIAGKIVRGEPIQLTGQDGLVFNPVHVSDAARAFAAALKRDVAGVYNIAGTDVATLASAAEKLGAMIGRPPVFERLDGDAMHMVAETRRMERDLMPPTKTLADGLGELIEVGS